MTVPTKKNRAQRQQTSGGAGSRTGPLPTVPEQDPLAGTNAFTSGRGYVLAPPSVDSLMAALKLFDDGGAAAQAPAAAAILPTGSTWPVLAIVTPEGLQTHAVEPSMGAAADSRDPRRLTMSKRRSCEE